MKIKEVSEQFGVSADTIRFYEKIGLIGPIEKRNGIRHFKKTDLEHLNFVFCMKRSGMELETIVHFIELYEQGPATLPLRLELLEKQRLQTVEKMDQLQHTLAYLDKKVAMYQQQLDQHEKIAQ